METKAHHFLIGSTALLTAVGGVILAIWISAISFEETLPYRVYFDDPVTDLAAGTAVRLNGVRVGSVDEVRLDPVRPYDAVVTIEVSSDIVLTEATTATLQSEGMIGPAYVGIMIGDEDAPPLRHDAPEPPIIPSVRTGLNQLLAMAPEIVSQVSGMTANLEEVTDEIVRHREAIGSVMADVASTTSSLDRAAADMIGIIGDAGNAIQQVNALITGLDGVLAARLEPMMASAEETLSALAGAAGQAEGLIAENRGQIDRFTTQGLRDISQLVAETRRMVDNMSSLVAQLERHPTSVLFGAPQPTFRPEAR